MLRLEGGARGRSDAFLWNQDHSLAQPSDLTNGSSPSPEGVLSNLTARQSEIASLVAQGRTNKQIARELGISDKTVKCHVHAILVKLDLPRRSAVGLAIRGE